MVWGKREDEELKTKKARSGWQFGLQCIERDFWDGHGVTGWSVRWDYCPVSALYNHTHAHAHTHSKHTHLKSKDREEEKAGLVDQVPVGSRVFPSPALSVEPPGWWACVPLCVCVCVMPKYKSEIGLAPPTHFYFPSVSVCQSEWCCGPPSSRGASHPWGGSQLVEQDVGVAAAHLAGGHWRYSVKRERGGYVERRELWWRQLMTCPWHIFRLVYGDVMKLSSSVTLAYNNSKRVGKCMRPVIHMFQSGWERAVEWCVMSECSAAGRSLEGVTGCSQGSRGDTGGEEDYLHLLPSILCCCCCCCCYTLWSLTDLSVEPQCGHC